MDTKIRGATFTCTIDTVLSAWIPVAPRNLCPEILVVGLYIPGWVVFLILSENIRWVVGRGLVKLISTCENVCGYIRYFLFALARALAIKLLACTCTCTCYCSKDFLIESAGLPAFFMDVIVIHLAIAASPRDCFCVDLCFAALARYSLSVQPWYTFGWVPVLQYLLA